MEYTYYSYLTRNVDILVSYLEDAIDEKSRNMNRLNCIMDYMTNSKMKNFVHDMIRDEEKHLLMFQKLLQEFLSGKIVQPKETTGCEVSKLEDGLESIILDKGNALDQHRKILFLLEDRFHKEQLFEIITDEFRHLSLLNMLYVMNDM